MGYFMTANGSQVLVLPLRFSTTLPVTLQDGESVELFFERDGLDQAASDGSTEIVYGFVTDTAGQVYKAWYPGYRPPSRSIVERVKSPRARIDIPPPGRQRSSIISEGDRPQEASRSDHQDSPCSHRSWLSAA